MITRVWPRTWKHIYSFYPAFWWVVWNLEMSLRTTATPMIAHP